MVQHAATPDENLRLSRPSRQGDEIKISSGVSWSRRGVDLIETLQYTGAFIYWTPVGLYTSHQRVLRLIHVLYHFDQVFTPTVFLSTSRAQILWDRAKTTPRLFEMYVTHNRNILLKIFLRANFAKSRCQNRGSEHLVEMIQSV